VFAGSMNIAGPSSFAGNVTTSGAQTYSGSLAVTGATQTFSNTLSGNLSFGNITGTSTDNLTLSSITGLSFDSVGTSGSPLGSFSASTTGANSIAVGATSGGNVWNIYTTGASGIVLNSGANITLGSSSDTTALNGFLSAGSNGVQLIANGSITEAGVGAVTATTLS
jgi:hypothetical protein